MTQAPRISSPCIRHCCLDEQDICVGCWRRLSEIRRWHSASDRERKQILEYCRQRAREVSHRDGFS